MVAKKNKQVPKPEIETMEKEIVYLQGQERAEAMKKYRKLIEPSLKEPVFLSRSD